jgi:hypothetical protein
MTPYKRPEVFFTAPLLLVALVSRGLKRRVFWLYGLLETSVPKERL